MCARCEELEEENAYLRSELGLADRSSMVATFRSSLGIDKGSAEVLAILYATTRVLNRYQVLDRMPARHDRADDDRDPKAVDVRLARIRKRMGADMFENVWGLGWRLSPEGRKRVQAALATALKIGEAA